MEGSNPRSTPPQYNVDPAGDLILLVGQEENQIPIRVSSKVLGLASPVLATMFGPRYLEGYVLSNQSKFSNPSFSLPDEDPEAMTWFCRALHLQVDGNETGLTLGLRLQIATLCDKYDASTALSGWSQSWLRDLSDPMVRDPTVPSSYAAKVLLMSYAFKNQWTFWLVTRDIVYHSSLEDIRGLKDRSKDYMLPDRLLDSVETECRTALLALQRAIEGVISPYTDHLCIPYRPVHREMCGVLIVTGQYFQELSRLGLWPMAALERPDAGSFFQLKERISEFEICSVRSSNNTCLVPHIDIKGALQMAADEIFRNQKGLCLRCVNEGKIMVSDGNCRAESHDSCSMND